MSETFVFGQPPSTGGFLFHSFIAPLTPTACVLRFPYLISNQPFMGEYFSSAASESAQQAFHRDSHTEPSTGETEQKLWLFRSRLELRNERVLEDLILATDRAQAYDLLRKQHAAVFAAGLVKEISLGQDPDAGSQPRTSRVQEGVKPINYISGKP